jgi:uncharacterized protein with HEPN domain
MSAPRDWIEYFNDMLLEAKLAQQFIEGVTYDDFVMNLEKQRAVIRCVEIIGEAARNVPASVRKEYPEIEWRGITGMRDRLIHGYPNIRLRVVWDTVKEKLPPLQAQVQKILDDLGKSSDES